MGYDAPDPYHQPEQFDLKPVGEVSWSDEGYSFDFTVVWHHKDGSFYAASDSGCSCPSPFERFTSLSDAEHLADVPAVLSYLEGLLDERRKDEYWMKSGSGEGALNDVLDLTSKLVRMRATPQEVEQAIESIKEAIR